MRDGPRFLGFAVGSPATWACRRFDECDAVGDVREFRSAACHDALGQYVDVAHPPRQITTSASLPLPADSLTPRDSGSVIWWRLVRIGWGQAACESRHVSGAAVTPLLLQIAWRLVSSPAT